MRRFLAASLVTLLSGVFTACVPMQEDVRVERGSLLRMYDRDVQLGNKTIQAIVTPRWPQLQLAFFRYDTCRTEKVEEYSEERITERSSRGVGPAITLGIVGTLVGGGLLLGRPAFSGSPNTNVIDASGNYGPSPRQVATGWGSVALIVGIPALAVGLIDYGRTGESVESVKGEQVISARDSLCKPEPVDGAVEFLDGPGPRSHETIDSTLLLGLEQVRELGDFTANVNGEPVFFTREEDEKLNAFRACAQVLPPPPAEELAGISMGVLRTRLDLLEACEDVAPQAVKEGRAAYEAALGEQVKRERPVPSTIGPRLESFDEVAQLYAPKRRAADGTTDALALARGELKPAEALYLVGQVRSRATVEAAIVEANGSTVLVPMTGDTSKVSGIREQRKMDVAHVQVGNAEIVVLLDPGSVWDAAVRGGAQLEFIGVVRSAQDAEGKPIPFVEALWARSAK